MAEEFGKWISVKEKLPELHQDIWIALTDRHARVGYRSTYGYKWWGGGCRLDEVTHWMKVACPKASPKTSRGEK